MELRTHTGVVVTMIDTAGLDVYRGIGPPAPHDSVPYCVVYSGDAHTEGPSGDPDSDVSMEVQVTSIGDSEEQAAWMADRVRNTLLSVTPPTPPSGRAWLRPQRPIDHVLTRPCERDDDAGPGAPLYYIASVYAIPTTPS